MRRYNFISSATAHLIFGAFIIGGSTAPGVARELNHQNEALKIRVEYRLTKEKILTNNNISVVVGKKSIVLSGTVPTLYKKDRAAKLTQKIADGFMVTDYVTVSAPAVADSIIDAKVMNRIQTQAPYTVFDWAEANSNKGIVTLIGWVSDPQHIAEYMRQAERVIGVKRVINRLRYVFRYRRLAWKAVNLIYRRGDLFPGASLTFNPPVHVIAVDGSVILEGKMQASSFAASLANRVRYHTNAIRVYNEIRTPV